MDKINRYFLTITILITAYISMAQEMQTVPHVDLKKYAGKWYEIASYPNRFQKGCFCTTAEYSISEKGYLIVENRCNKGSANGKLSYTRGKIFIQDNSGNAKMNVRYLWLYRGKYWIIDLADDYTYAVVSNPEKRNLWILSRTPKMNETVYRQIISRLKEKGFDITKLLITPQIE